MILDKQTALLVKILLFRSASQGLPPATVVRRRVSVLDARLNRKQETNRIAHSPLLKSHFMTSGKHFYGSVWMTKPMDKHRDFCIECPAERDYKVGAKRPSLCPPHIVKRSADCPDK